MEDVTTEKVLIRRCNHDGTWFAILGNGWRYDGSMIIDATSSMELDIKIAQARYDDRWVTLEGNHVLIGGNGLIKAGVGGRLAGRKFGMRFKDYENGKTAKNGKKLIRPYKVFKGRGGNTEPTGKKTKTGAITHAIVQGRNLLAEKVKFDYRKTKPNEEDKNYMFKVVTEKQGFRGAAKVVNKKDFEKAVSESGIICYRGYTGSNEIIADQYRAAMRRGDWYTDCKGGSVYGRGMYCTSAKTESFTDEFTKESRRDAWRETFQYTNSRLNEVPRREAITLSTDAKIIRTDLFGKSTTMIEELWKKEYKKANPRASAKKIQQEADKRGDVGTMAAELGYDAILVKNAGMISDYMVILNRTKAIFLDSGAPTNYEDGDKA